MQSGRLSVICAAVVILCLQAPTVVNAAENMVVGHWSVAAKKIVLKLKKNVAVFSGGVSFSNASTNEEMEPGSLRLDSIRSASATVELGTDKKGKQVLKTATASGGVTLKGKRANVTQGADGKSLVVMQDLLATAKTAEIPDGEERAILTGNVVVKILNPGSSVPATYVTGDKVEVLFSESEISISAAPEGMAEIKIPVSAKEKDKSHPYQK